MSVTKNERVNLGRALRVLRAARGMSQRELAARAGLHESFISHVESDRRNTSMQTVGSLAEALCVPCHILILLSSREELRRISPDEARRLIEVLFAPTDDNAEGGDV